MSGFLQFEEEDDQGDAVGDGHDQVGKQKGESGEEFDEPFREMPHDVRIGEDRIRQTAADEGSQHQTEAPPDAVKNHA